MSTASGASTTAEAQSRVARASYRAGRLLGRLDALTARLRPWMVLGPLVVAGWVVAVWVGHAASHTGRLYHDGGEGTWTWTTAWLLIHGLIPYGAGGYLYSLLLAPLAGIAGGSLLDGAPWAIAVNVAVLGPLALLCVYGLARSIAGRRYAYVVSALWVLAPVIVIPYFLLDYHRRYVGFQLPGNVGLTTVAEFPSMAAVLVSAYFACRALASRDDLDALTAGLAAGLAVAIQPRNAYFLPAPLLALAVARRPRALGLLLAGAAPAILCLVLWRYRSLGDVPLSLHVSRHLLSRNIDGFREFTWSRRLVEWAVIAGFIGLVRRSVPIGVLVGAWLASYFVLAGGSVGDFYGGSFFRALAPAFPAAFLCVMSLPLLIPVAGRRLASFGDLRGWPATQRSRRVVAGLAAFLAIAPVVPILALGRQQGASAATAADGSALVPVGTFALTAAVHDGRVTLAWPRRSAHGAHVVYGVLRSQADLLCAATGGARSCGFPAPVARTHATRFSDAPPAGRWTYRVVVLSGAPPPASEPVELSRAARVEVG